MLYNKCLLKHEQFKWKLDSLWPSKSPSLCLMISPYFVFVWSFSGSCDTGLVQVSVLIVHLYYVSHRLVLWLTCLVQAASALRSLLRLLNGRSALCSLTIHSGFFFDHVTQEQKSFSRMMKRQSLHNAKWWCSSGGRGAAGVLRGGGGKYSRPEQSSNLKMAARCALETQANCRTCEKGRRGVLNFFFLQDDYRLLLRP